MDKKQNLTSFQELTTTELNQITGGGWWEDLLYRFNLIEQNNTKGFNQPIQL
ncbi:TPA: quorum-sensing system pheromone BlpC [Streptococcus pneumoniae]|uniref:Quorum-sensing system pheromone BlpC n=1 Tax=Streptococcus shenyangsis TaxID=2589786 RepID=A0ABY2YIC7_9STRE|nr:MULTISPECIES: quorum-sensing system pheromone BlpC [Streptococcus]MDU6292839.1 quorum-sensing system pheromone BlpC [Streptococcus mitis]TMR79064.1 quorum-sensing system pheromone BlpC [Streptococcus pseudopneumoniae]TPE40456.1 quorum-sensing system pheromone BlpC [Streptococcus shenyangsis]TPE40779.1 quorum-sensing system pheromone BlpC [Streptococcus sp. D2]